MKRKIVSLLTMGVLAISLIGCGNAQENTTAPATQENNTVSEVITEEEIPAPTEEIGGMPDFANTQIKDTVFFGTYNENPVEWIVLDHQDGKTLLISKFGLEMQSFYSTESREVTWATSDIRTWLNEDLYNSMFSDEEKEMIVLSHLTTPGASADIWGERPADQVEKYPWADGSEDTDDNIFLLSVEEVRQYFGVKPDYEYPEGYTISGDADFLIIEDADGNRMLVDDQVRETYSLPSYECFDLDGNPCNYMLRSPGKLNGSIAIIGTRYSMTTPNIPAYIRPAIWVKD